MKSLNLIEGWFTFVDFYKCISSIFSSPSSFWEISSSSFSFSFTGSFTLVDYFSSEK